MASIVHFNLTAEDPAALADYYRQLFDWKIEELPNQAQPYYLIRTKNLAGIDGIGGGIAVRDKNATPGMINYIGVASLEQSLNMVVKLGGKIIQPKQIIPGFGYLAVAMDPAQNIFGLFEEKPNAD